MGAFCIYGISYSDCLAVAERKVSATEFVGKDEWRNLSLAEWAAKRDKVAKELFENGTRLTRVSPEFDAPQFCKDWLAINPANVRNAEIRVWGGQEGCQRRAGAAQGQAGNHLGQVRRHGA